MRSAILFEKRHCCRDLECHYTTYHVDVRLELQPIIDLILELVFEIHPVVVASPPDRGPMVGPMIAVGTAKSEHCHGGIVLLAPPLLDCAENVLTPRNIVDSGCVT